MGGGGYVKITVKGRNIILEPLEPSADRCFGAFKIEIWPQDLDEFVFKALKRGWTSQSM